MWVWIFMLLSIVGFWVLIPDALGKKKKNLIFLGLCFLLIVFVMGSRSPHLMNSADLRNYYRLFSRSSRWTTEQLLQHYTTMADGYLILNEIVSWISPWPYTFQYVQAAFCTYVILWYIYRNSDNVFLSVMIYVCIGPWQFFLTGFRQSIAVCICVIAMECLKKRARSWDVVAIIITLLATTMHVTAWVFLLAFLIRSVKITKKILIYVTCVILILFVFIDDIVAFGNNMVQRDYAMKSYGNTFGGVVPIFIYLATLILVYFIWTKDKDYLNKNGFEVAILIFGLCVYVLRYSASIMERISFYFTPVICVVLANAITRQKGKGAANKILPAVSVALCIVLFTYRSFEQYGVYYFYWEYLERLIYI